MCTKFFVPSLLIYYQDQDSCDLRLKIIIFFALICSTHKLAIEPVSSAALGCDSGWFAMLEQSLR